MQATPLSSKKEQGKSTYVACEPVKTSLCDTAAIRT